MHCTLHRYTNRMPIYKALKYVVKKKVKKQEKTGKKFLVLSEYKLKL